jgi:hypothetical protein
MKRRSFLKAGAAAVPGIAGFRLPVFGQTPEASTVHRKYTPGNIVNEYTAFLPGEQQALSQKIEVPRIVMQYQTVEASVGGEQKTLKVGESIQGWKLLAVLPWHNGMPTAVFEKHVTHQGALVFVNAGRELARVPKQIGDLSKIKPREIISPPGMKFERPPELTPGPDQLGRYILDSDQDPCYENVAALGAEYTGWTLVSDDGVGAPKSIWLEPDGKSRQFSDDPQDLWAPDANGRLFEPFRLLPLPLLYTYKPGYSKRTMLGGFLPAADIGVWNPDTGVGYEVMMALSAGGVRKPIARIRATLHPEQNGSLPSWYKLAPLRTGGRATDAQISDGVMDRYWNGTAAEFYSAVLGLWERWTTFFDNRMQVEIPDPWLLQASKAGIVAARCSYRGLEPTYQIGEGSYTKIPERSHALFPVAHYEFVWAQQLWNQTEQVEPYFQHYLDQYVLPDGNFTYNTQDQVEAPLNVGVFLRNSARAYDYAGDVDALRRRLPVLQRMIDNVMSRRAFTKASFPESDPRHGLIWGSPEADNGDPDDDTPTSHLYYYQNAAWLWRGLKEHGRCLQRAGKDRGDNSLSHEGIRISEQAKQLRTDIERSLRTTLDARNTDLKQAGITPFSAFDTSRKPEQLSSYENHRYMMDWWTADWGDADLDAGHFRHRTIAGQEVVGMNSAADGIYATDSGTLLTSNFMEHGTLAGRIRLADHRPFLLTLYGNLCFAMDSGNRYAPEDALIPGGFAGEGAGWTWSAVVNSALQPTLALRWLLCYEESDVDRIHLQKAAPKNWFAPGQKILVNNCPTRFGHISWSTESQPNTPGWTIKLEVTPSTPFPAEIVVHIHPPNGGSITSSSVGRVSGTTVVVPAATFAGKGQLSFRVL